VKYFSKNIAFLKSRLENSFPPNRLDELCADATCTADEFAKLGALSGYSLERLFNEDLELASKFHGTIKFVVFDVDGVLTDAGMYYTESGDEFKRFNARDGLAMKALPKFGIQTGIISHGINENLIRRRAALLNIERVYCGTQPKLEILSAWCSEMGIALKEVAYIGDDVNDLPLFEHCGFTAAPADALPAVKKLAHVVLQNKGGFGCVREWIDAYILPQPLT
jgi:YrbI family 3-deoxy-D-manno-octulosonate 8-phosphate phosphatase